MTKCDLIYGYFRLPPVRAQIKYIKFKNASVHFSFLSPYCERLGIYFYLSLLRLRDQENIKQWVYIFTK